MGEKKSKKGCLLRIVIAIIGSFILICVALGIMNLTSPSSKSKPSSTRPSNMPTTMAPLETTPESNATQTPTSRPTNTPLSSLPSGSVVQAVNLRAGPGTYYDKVGGLAAGDQFEIMGQTENGEWYCIKLASGEVVWLAAFLVTTEADSLPIIQSDQIPPSPTVPPPATTTVPPTNTAVSPTATPVPPTDTPQPQAICTCAGDTLNCSDFDTQAQAQACYDYCVSQGRGDIHGLDGSDHDGRACESLP